MSGCYTKFPGKIGLESGTVLTNNGIVDGGWATIVAEVASTPPAEMADANWGSDKALVITIKPKEELSAEWPVLDISGYSIGYYFQYDGTEESEVSGGYPSTPEAYVWCAGGYQKLEGNIPIAGEYEGNQEIRRVFRTYFSAEGVSGTSYNYFAYREELSKGTDKATALVYYGVQFDDIITESFIKNDNSISIVFRIGGLATDDWGRASSFEGYRRQNLTTIGYVYTEDFQDHDAISYYREDKVAELRNMWSPIERWAYKGTNGVKYTTVQYKNGESGGEYAIPCVHLQHMNIDAVESLCKIKNQETHLIKRTAFGGMHQVLEATVENNSILSTVPSYVSAFRIYYKNGRVQWKKYWDAWNPDEETKRSESEAHALLLAQNGVGASDEAHLILISFATEGANGTRATSTRGGNGGRGGTAAHLYVWLKADDYLVFQIRRRAGTLQYCEGKTNTAYTIEIGDDIKYNNNTIMINDSSAIPTPLYYFSAGDVAYNKSSNALIYGNDAQKWHMAISYACSGSQGTQGTTAQETENITANSWTTGSEAVRFVPSTDITNGKIIASVLGVQSTRAINRGGVGGLARSVLIDYDNNEDVKQMMPTSGTSIAGSDYSSTDYSGENGENGGGGGGGGSSGVYSSRGGYTQPCGFIIYG